MDEPTNITLAHAQVVGIDVEYPGLLSVEVTLDPEPDEDWQRIFAQQPSGESFSASMHPPRISAGRVTIRPPDDQLEKYMDALRKRVAATNADYDRIVRPKLGQLEAARQAELAERQHRITEAQRKLDDDIA
jgi:hypothetical protein